MASGKIVIARKFGHASRGKICIFLLLGFMLGLGLGYLIIGTVQAIIETSNQGTKPRHHDPVPAKATSHRKTAAGGGAATTQASIDDDGIHVLTTSNGSPYQNWQMRIAYATYKLTCSMPGGQRYKGFTRILHRTKPDELMDEIPTFRADPIQPECDEYCVYPVSDRANAVHQFFDAAEKRPSMIKAPWLYMIESDYIFMKPLELPPPTVRPTASERRAWGFPFDYITPHMFPNEMKMIWGEGDPNTIPSTGPAPILMRVEDWKRITPEWERLAAFIEGNKHLVETLGWVREMYGFSIALRKNNIVVDLAPKGQNKFISELPVEDALGAAHAYHYTLCAIYKTIDGDEDVWKFDKRFHTEAEEVRRMGLHPVPPEFQPGKWKFIEGNPVTKEKHESIVEMIKQLNRGIDTMKEL